MKILLRLLLFIAIIFIGTHTYAQNYYGISGLVIDEKGQPIKNATVFISGSQKITMANDEGRFTFTKITPGSYQLSATMLGYAPYSQNVIITTGAININIPLKVRPTALNEVLIGSAKTANKNYTFFKSKFLGTSANARQCVITNPEVINFSTSKGVLLANSDQFLIIENKRLGYRIRYLLKDFQYKNADLTSLYEGETSFEELQGTPEMQKEWAINRAEAYKGSFMHFLRSVYANRVLKEGFLARQIYRFIPFKNGNSAIVTYMNRVLLDERPIGFDSLVTVSDTSFISLRFPMLYVTYEPKTTAKIKTTAISPSENYIELDNEIGSIIKLTSDKALVDQKGSYTNYKAFYIEGNWGRKRVADQLPFEYQPPK
jgi:hypothetical protein